MAWGKGAIIWCEDGSASMSGQKEMWAKAIGLCFLHYARTDGRAFHAIHFGSRTQLVSFDFVRPEDFTPERILDFAETFLAGGTDFEAPLTAAVIHMQNEEDRTGRVNGDVVLCTDGQCGVRPDWLKDFKYEQNRLGFAVWGVTIGGSKADEPLAAIADSYVTSVEDLTDAGDVADLLDLLWGTQRDLTATVQLASEKRYVSELTL